MSAKNVTSDQIVNNTAELFVVVERPLVVSGWSLQVLQA